MNIISVNGRSINVSKALPLTLGDWEDLEKEGVGQSDLAAPSAKHIVTFMHFVLRKADANVTRDEVRGLAMDGPEVKAILDTIKGDRTDPKSSMSSISSVELTDGVKVT